MTDVLDAIADKFTITEDGCWEWTAFCSQAGYGVLVVNRKQRRAHKVVYEMLVGPVPEGLELDHLCNNKKCIHPDHLAAVTHRENSLRGLNNPFAMNARKTHCKRGHEFTPENTYPRKDGRECLTCKIQRRRGDFPDS